VLISGWRFSMIDNDHFDWAFRGFEPQSKLLLESLCDGRARYARIGRRRWHRRGGVIGHKIHLQVENFAGSRPIDYAPAQ